jgi:hypothetical protein
MYLFSEITIFDSSFMSHSSMVRAHVPNNALANAVRRISSPNAACDVNAEMAKITHAIRMIFCSQVRRWRHALPSEPFPPDMLNETTTSQPADL